MKDVIKFVPRYVSFINGDSVCNTCNKFMEGVWDIICWSCRRTFCYKCSVEHNDLWFCHECLEVLTRDVPKEEEKIIRKKIGSYELSLKGTISFENLDHHNQTLTEAFNTVSTLGMQIAEDGRIWICIDGISFIRFKPKKRIQFGEAK